MSLLRKNLIVVILVLLVYSWYFISQSLNRQGSPSILGANSNIYLFLEPDSGEKPIVDEIDKAKTEILVEIYLLSDKAVISELESAAKRGVAVDVMLEEHPFGGGSLNQKAEKELKSHNVAIEWTNPEYSLTHEKTIVVDQKEVFILSQNLTGSSFTKNREFDVLDTNPQDVLEVRSIFISDWQRKSPSLNSPNLLVSPVNSREGISSLIKNSSKSLELETEDIDDPRVISLLIDRAKSIPVRLIIPTFTQLPGNKKAVEELSSGGVSVKTLSSLYVHGKMILSDDAKAYVGSNNLSSQSLDENREVGIILTEPRSLVSLHSTFESDWTKGNSLTP